MKKASEILSEWETFWRRPRRKKMALLLAGLVLAPSLLLWLGLSAFAEELGKQLAARWQTDPSSEPTGLVAPSASQDNSEGSKASTASATRNANVDSPAGETSDTQHGGATPKQGDRQSRVDVSPQNGIVQHAETGDIESSGSAKVAVGKVKTQSPTPIKQEAKTGSINASGDSEVNVGVIEQ